jgi:hypothetical protein
MYQFPRVPRQENNSFAKLGHVLVCAVYKRVVLWVGFPIFFIAFFSLHPAKLLY